MRRHHFYINNEADESDGFNAEGRGGGGLYLIFEKSLAIMDYYLVVFGCINDLRVRCAGCGWGEGRGAIVATLADHVASLSDASLPYMRVS